MGVEEVGKDRAGAGQGEAVAGGREAADGAGGMLLDALMPVYQFSERHATEVRAATARVWRVLWELPPAEIPLLGALFRLRALPARLVGRRTRRFADAEPVLAQVLRGGFVLLDEAPERELVLGTIGQFWRLTGGSSASVAGRQEFLAFDQPGYAKAAMNFHLDAAGGGDLVRVSTQTRVCMRDPVARRKFAAYWRVIYPGSAVIRIMWLRAVKRRAEGC